MILLIVLLPLIYFFICYKFTMYIDKGSRENLNFKLIDKIIFLIEVIAIAILFRIRCDINLIEFLLLSYMTGYLLFQSYTDYKMKEVYCFYNYIATAIGIISSVAYVLVSNFDQIVLIPKIIGMAGVIVFLLIAKIAKLYGGGDGEVIFACSLLLFPTSSLLSPNGLFIGIVIGLFITVVFKLIFILLKKTDTATAMVPSIAIGIYLAILIGV